MAETADGDPCRACLAAQCRARALIAELDAVLGAVYEPHQRHGLSVETGTEQAAAIRLYQGYGFRPCAAFGHYATLEPHRISASLFYEMPLSL